VALACFAVPGRQRRGRRTRARPTALADRWLQRRSARSHRRSRLPETLPAGAHPSSTFSDPQAVATDDYGNVYVSSFGTNSTGSKGRIDVFCSNGRFVSELVTTGPTSLAIDSKGYLYTFSNPDIKGPVRRFTPDSPYQPEACGIKYSTAAFTVTESLSAYSGLAINRDNDHLFADFGNERRPNFTLTPTGCGPKEIKASLRASNGQSANLSDGFQATNCAKLGFKPKLSIKLKGGTKRGDFPALRAVVTPRAGDANFAGAAVTLPHSAFLEQGHIRTICTRVQFAAGAGFGSQCPKGSIYGKAKATTPLLDQPLEGPVFLRSSNHNLPDLVVALSGPIDVELSSRIDSVKGGIRSTFIDVPDAPVSKFILEMQGGQKGLIVNSRDLCVHKSRGDAVLEGQNGRVSETRPVLGTVKCATQKRRASHG
jgi:hypothetical protein